MGNDSNPKLLTASGTTTFGSVLLMDIAINSSLVGNLVIKDGTIAMGTLLANTPPGNYHTLPNGGRYGSLVMSLSGNDNVTVYTRLT